METIKAQFKPAVVTDLSVVYSFSRTLSASVNANNLLNILPEWDLVGLPAVASSAVALRNGKSPNILCQVN